MATWTGFLNSGGSRTQVAQAVIGSAEFRNILVEVMYGTILHRAPDPTGLALMVGLLGMGFHDEFIEAGLAGSPEYFSSRGGSTVQGFLTALYQDVLNRAPDSAGLAFWEAHIAAGMSHTQVAFSLLTSVERFHDDIGADYATLLHRGVDATGLNTWTAVLQGGARNEDVMAAIIGSQEYFNQAQV